MAPDNKQTGAVATVTHGHNTVINLVSKLNLLNQKSEKYAKYGGFARLACHEGHTNSNSLSIMLPKASNY